MDAFIVMGIAMIVSRERTGTREVGKKKNEPFMMQSINSMYFCVNKKK